MTRDEILSKAKNESSDEMEVQVHDKSMKWTYITMVVIAAIFAFIRAEKYLPMMDLCTTVGASVAVGMLYRYFKTKEKSTLVLGIISAAVAIFGLVRYIMGY